MDKSKLLFLDTETTGVSDSDEILSLAIVDAAGTVLLDTYITPTRHTEWPVAMERNHITPEFIFAGGFPTIAELTSQVLDIVTDKSVVAYGMEFDAQMLENNGIDLRLNASVHCCMNRFAIWNGQPSTRPYHVTGYRTLKLTEAAELTGYAWVGAPHGALADTKACRHVWLWLDENESDGPEIVVI